MDIAVKIERFEIKQNVLNLKSTLLYYINKNNKVIGYLTDSKN